MTTSHSFISDTPRVVKQKFTKRAVCLCKERDDTIVRNVTKMIQG